MTDLEVERNAVSGLYGQTLIIILVTLSVTGFGVYSIFQIPLGAVPDITNNQVQVITTDPDSKTVMCFAQMTGADQSELINNI